MTTYGGPMPDDFVDGEVLTANDFNRVKNYWVSSEFPTPEESAQAQDGDVVFVLDNSEFVVEPTLVALFDTDIDTETLATGQVLMYDATSGMWVNSTNDVSADIASLQSQIDANAANISANATNITNNTTNISNLSGTVSSLSTTVDTHTTQITALEEGGGGGGSATLWSGTVTAVMNGDQQTIEVAAGDPINATIIAANKARGFCYIGDKVVGGTVDGGYAIISREFNYPDMPAFDPTGGLNQDGADQGKPVNDTMYLRDTSAGFGPRVTCIAPFDSVSKTVYWQAKNDGSSGRDKYIEYRSITDSSLYGTLYLPNGREPFRPLNYAGFLVTGACLSPTGQDFSDNVVPLVYYWDWRVQSWGELVGFDTMIDNLLQTIGGSWTNGTMVYYPPYLYNGRDGKLHAMTSVWDGPENKYVTLHATYEYSTDPLSGTWTVQHYKEFNNGNFGLDHKYYNAFTPNYDFTGAGIIERRSTSPTNSFYYYWWDFDTNGLSYMNNIDATELTAISATVSPSDAAKPNSSAALYQGDNNIKMITTDWSTGSESVIDLTSFPLTKYRMKFTDPSLSYRIINGIFDHRNGYFISAIDNYVDGKFEVWKFDLFGQANMIAEYPYNYNWYDDNTHFGQHTPASGIGSENSDIVLFLSHKSSWIDSLIYWVDISA
jgi:hypothetical protein